MTKHQSQITVRYSDIKSLTSARRQETIKRLMVLLAEDDSSRILKLLKNKNRCRRQNQRTSNRDKLNAVCRTSLHFSKSSHINNPSVIDTTLTPVSYTHLDVYKRQQQYRGTAIPLYNHNSHPYNSTGGPPYLCITLIVPLDVPCF